MIKGIVFDFDGTILDTEASTHQAWMEIYREHGVVLPFDLWASTVGTSENYFDPVIYLESKTGNKLDGKSIRDKQAALELEILRSARPLPGVINYLDDARRMGINLGIASSSSFEWVDSNLRIHGLSDYFTCVITREQVVQTKPFPYLYEKAVKALGLFPYQVIAIEDSPMGVTAAQAAGIFTVAVPNSLTSRLNLDHANICINSLADLPLRDLLEQISV